MPEVPDRFQVLRITSLVGVAVLLGLSLGALFFYYIVASKDIKTGQKSQSTLGSLRSFIVSMLLYLALVLILGLGLGAFLLIKEIKFTDSGVGMSLYFVALYVTIGTVINALYTHLPALDYDSQPGMLDNIALALYYAAVYTGYFAIILIRPVLNYFSDRPYLLIPAYAVSGLIFYTLSKVMTKKLHLTQRSQVLDNVSKVIITITALMMIADAFVLEGYARIAEEVIVLATGHSFWILTDFRALKAEIKTALSNRFLLISLFIFVGASLFFSVFPDFPSYYVASFSVGFGIGILRIIRAYYDFSS